MAHYFLKILKNVKNNYKLKNNNFCVNKIVTINEKFLKPVSATKKKTICTKLIEFPNQISKTFYFMFVLNKKVLRVKVVKTKHIKRIKFHISIILSFFVLP